MPSRWARSRTTGEVCDVPRHLLDRRLTLVGAKLAQVLDDDELARPQAEPLNFLSGAPIFNGASKLKPYASAVIGSTT